MSASITRSLTVDRPIGAVGRYLVDFAHSAQWGPPHIASCTRVDDGPIRVGARYRTVAAVGPLTETIEQTVVEYDTERRIVVDGRSRYLRTRDELTCTPVLGGGTCVTYTARVELVGRARVGAAALGPFLALAADQGAERLRRTVLEAVPAPHPDRRGGAVPLRGVAGCPAPAADDGRGPAV